MKIKTTGLDRLTRWEAFQLFADALAFAEILNETMPQLFVTRVNELRTAFDAFDEALVRERNASPEALIAAEEARDYGIRKLYALLVEFSDYRFDAAKESAAQSLLQIFKPYGTGYDIARLRQDTETAVLTNLLQDLEKEQAVAHLAALGFSDIVVSVKENNTVFAESQQSRRDEQSQFIAGLVKSTRADAQLAFRAFIDAVNALVIVEGEEKYAKLVAQLNTLIDDYLSKARQRQGKKASDTPSEPLENSDETKN